MNFKNYQFIKIKAYIKSHCFLLFSNGINQTCENWVQTEQKLKKIKLNYYKTYNKLTRMVLKKSRFLNYYNSITGLCFFLTIDQKKNYINKKILFSNDLISLFFTVIYVKLNNKIYSKIQIKRIFTLNYKTTINVLYQFLLVNLKSFYFIK